MTSKKLLDSNEIAQLESRFISIFERTIKKGFGVSGPQLKTSIIKQFKSSTFQKQIDTILDDIVLYTVDYTDKELSKLLKAAVSSRNKGVKLSASREVLPLTEEAVKQSTELSELISESIIRTLKDEAIYQESPGSLAVRVLDLWGGEKYRAVRFARTFSADVATSTALNRYKNNGIEEVQFYAKIDERTSPQCRALMGTVFKTDSKEASIYKPPLHHMCRSCLLPVALTTKIDDSLRYENRDFGKQVGQDFKPLKDELDKKVIKNVFKDIDKFKDKYAIDKFILEEDIEKRLMKLGVNVDMKISQNGIQSYERGIARNKTETAYVFDKNGKIIIEKEGTVDSVNFTKAELKRMKGNVLTHNHPGEGMSFSVDDIRLACKHGLNEIRATTKNGTFVMRMADGSNFNEDIYINKIHAVFEKYREQEVKQHLYRMQDTKRKIKVTEEESLVRASKSIWLKTTKEIPELQYDFVGWD